MRGILLLEILLVLPLANALVWCGRRASGGYRPFRIGRPQ
jgi:hypothetical protein